MILDFNLQSTEVKVEPVGYRMLDVSLEDVDTDNVLDQISIENVISHFTEFELLQNIGLEKAIEFWGKDDILERLNEKE